MTSHGTMFNRFEKDFNYQIQQGKKIKENAQICTTVPLHLRSLSRKHLCDEVRSVRPETPSHLDAAQTVSRRLLQLSGKWPPFGLKPGSCLKASALLPHLWGL